MQHIRVGVIGTGNWANYGHLPAMALVPGFEVRVVQARRREAAVTTASRFGIPRVVDTVEELVSADDVDLVVVLTTAPQHAESVRAAVAAGKHVYSEWPLTTGSGIASELLTLAEEAGVRHFVGLQRRLAPHTRYIADLVREGYIGELRSARMHVSMNYLQATRVAALAWTAPDENFSSVAAIYGGHFLDMLFAMTGGPDSLSASLVNQFPLVTIAETQEQIHTTSPDQLVLHARTASGVVFTVHIEGGKRNGSGVEIDLTGTGGDIRVTNVSAFGGVGEDYVVEGAHGDDLPLSQLVVPASYDWLPANELASSVQELGHLYAAISRDLDGGSRVAPDLADGLWMHRFFDAMQASSDTGSASVGLTQPDHR
ncbi:Gfo/Idh/MocA family protein [Herbiconiux sp. P17]|uniref:Gfo/Idh/MocA family protein n=1 Tax=Herbiconiux wuyangfengii TaxID=3342794 RepID=UPI0035B9AEE7